MLVINSSLLLIASLIVFAVDAAPAFHFKYKPSSSFSSSCSPTCDNPDPDCSNTIMCPISCGCESGFVMDQRQQRCVKLWQCSLPDYPAPNEKKH